MELQVHILPDEYWYGLCVDKGGDFPLSASSTFHWHATTQFSGNQEAPFLVSSMGRYLWSESPYDVDAENGTLTITNAADDLTLHEGYQTLRGAYLDAYNRYFRHTEGVGVLPPRDFFIKPQYNTWAELIYDQTSERILAYARAILANGLPAGIMMIDDGWMRYYGSREFNQNTIPDPGALVRELHDMGFTVMLWICPFVSPDSAEFRDLEAKRYLVRDRDGNTAIRHWWNGYSAVVDLSHPDAYRWFYDNMRYLQTEYGFDGFKMDAGDVYFYRDDDCTYGNVTAHEQCALWEKLGAQFPYNEFRASYKGAGLPLVERLCDKAHRWDSLPKLVTDILAQGILGFPYGCPDMIGGGSFVDFLPGAPSLDPELFVRYAQCAALMPMMQYSAGPWRVLDKTHAAYCLDAGRIHMEFADEILAIAENATKTGEPIVRYLEYVFPHEGLAVVTDAFLLGDRILVCPVLSKNADTRTREVLLPRGTWRYVDGTCYTGGTTVTVGAGIDMLPYFIRV